METKNEQIWLRVKPNEKEEIKREAEKRGLSLSEYVRQLVFENRNKEQANGFEVNLGDYIFFEKLMNSGDTTSACNFIYDVMKPKATTLISRWKTDCIL